MSITLKADRRTVGIKRFIFSGGEVQVRLDDAPDTVERWEITALVRNSDDVMALLLVADAVRETGPARLDLVIPYLPYARQDRVAHRGEAFSLRVFARLIATAGFDSITSWDVHSAVALREIAGLVNVPASRFVGAILRPGESVVAPDAGAVDRARACATDRNPLVRAVKHRDTDTGRLSEPRLQDPVGPDDDLIVVDDICDGGRTFLQLGQVLRASTTGRLRLFVTHGIFSAGLDALLDIYDEILTANLFDPSMADRVGVVSAQP